MFVPLAGGGGRRRYSSCFTENAVRMFWQDHLVNAV